MALSVETYALAKKFTKDSLIGMGALKGAPCKVKSIVKENGQNIVTLQWEDNEGGLHEIQMFIDDGTPIYTWEPGYHYEYGDLAIYTSQLYRCIIPNSDSVFDESHWNGIGSPDGNYDIVERKTDLPIRFTPADRKMYFVINEAVFYLWNGTTWVPQNMSEEEIRKRLMKVSEMPLVPTAGDETVLYIGQTTGQYIHGCVYSYDVGQAKWILKDTTIKLNGRNVTGGEASFYAPLTAGERGQFVVSKGENLAPEWANITGYSPSILQESLIFTYGILPEVEDTSIIFDLDYT